MNDEDLTRNDLVAVLAVLRHRVAELEARLNCPGTSEAEAGQRRLAMATDQEEDALRSDSMEPGGILEDYRSVVRNASEAICITQNGFLKFANRAGTELTGYSEEELLSMAFAALVHPEDLEELVRIYMMRLRKEYVPPGHRFRIITKAGVVTWVESWSASIIWNGQPAVLSMIRDVNQQVHDGELMRQEHEELDRRVQDRAAKLQAINDQLIREISERKQAELSLRESEDRFRKLMERSPMAISVTDMKDEVRYLNQKFTELFGYTLEDIPTLDHWWQLAYPDLQYAGQVRSEWLNAIREGDKKATEALPVVREIRCKDGATRVIDVRKTVIDNWVIHTFLDVTENKRQKEALFESEQMFRLFSEQSLMSVAVLQDGVYKYANQAMSDLCEYSVEQILNWKPEEFLEVAHPDDRSLVMDQARKKQEGDPRHKTHYTFRIIPKSGVTKWVEIYSKTIQYKGTPANLLTMLDITERKKAEEALTKAHDEMAQRVDERTAELSVLNKKLAQDITERKKAEEALRKSEERLELALKGADLGLWDYNLQTGEAFVNARRAEMVGYELDEVEPHFTWWGKQVHPEDIRKVLEAFNNHLAGRTPLYECEHRLRHKSGQYIWILARGRVLDWNEQSHPVRIVGTSLDITDRKRTEEALQKAHDELEHRVQERTSELVGINQQLEQEIVQRKRGDEALRESEQRYRTLFEESRDAVYMTTRDGRLVDANQAFLNLFGLTREEAENMGILAIYAVPADRKRFQEDIERDGSLKDYEVKFRRKDGTVIECLVSSTLRLDKDGTIVGYQGIARDVTEQKLLQKQLFHSQKMEAIGTLAGGIAHDVNNLLQAVLGYADLLLIKKAPGDPDRKKLGVIQQAARDGADLVSRILTFSRKGESKTRPVDLNSEIRKSEELLKRTLPKMIQIELLLADDIAIIDADPAQLEQVILNLGVNAQHAMPDGGRLLIETKNVSLRDEYLRAHLGAKAGKYVLLTVSDTGFGIEAEVLDRIFEPFFTTKTNGLGTGLGLAMVHGIVLQHGGIIKCYSEPGMGTSFKIYFPVSSSVRKTGMASTREMPAFGTETILLVDDDDRVREMGKEMIEMGGYIVLTADSGEEALEVYVSHREEISLIILDLIMPGMGGNRCLEELLRIDPDVRVLVASGYSSNGLSQDAKGRGARGFVSKPYDAKEILIAIRSLLDKGAL